MSFLFVNNQELSALMGLPYIQQVTYLLGIKPHIDRQTSIVGIKRRISYQSLAEALYIEPHQGIQSGSPSRQQLRRIIKSLERAKLIQVQSDDKHLILKCLLAEQDNFVQNKADTNPTCESDTNPASKFSAMPEDVGFMHRKADIDKKAKADTPHKSENNNSCIVLLREKFEIFWTEYPNPQNQSKTWDAFLRLNPDDVLFEKIMTNLRLQIEHHHKNQQSGHWMPHWKYPANWLIQQSWNDELMTYKKMEKSDANHQRSTTKKSAVDILWESCKDGRNFEFSEENSNVIAFPEQSKYG